MTSILVTGGTGLLGRGVIAALAAVPDCDGIFALNRADVSGARRETHAKVRPVRGDLLLDGLGMVAYDRALLARDVTTVVHIAADTSFSQTLAHARRVNRDGTGRLLEECADWPNVSRWVYVSTAFVAGLRTGVVPEDATTGTAWANAYEQSKAEGEALVRAARADWTIVRPATVVCDDVRGGISQMNAVHRALRLYFGGLAAMLPGSDDSVVDVITTEYAVRGIVAATLQSGIEGRVFHLCAGAGAMGLDELLDSTYAAFARAPRWCRKGIARPVRADLETYRLFEQAIADVGSVRVRQALDSLSHFVPQLAYPKRFDTTAAEELLGERGPPVRTFWERMVNTLVDSVPVREAA